MTRYQKLFPNKISRISVCLLFIALLGSGCLLDVAGLGEAEAELATIPEVTPPPTQPPPTASPFPEYTRADALAIATDVAISRANSTPTVIPEPTEPYGASTPPESPYPLLEDGTNFRSFPGGLWYTTNLPAAEAQEFYIDRMTYFRWDDYTVGDTGEGYGQVQFVKNYFEVQVFVWENPGLDQTSVVVLEVEPALEHIRELPAVSYDDRFLVINEAEPDEEEEVDLDEPQTEYLAEYPLPVVNLFYTLRLLDAGWQVIPTERLSTYALNLQLFQDEERIVLILQDNGIGTTVTWVE